VPRCKYRTPVFCFPLRSKVFLSLLTILTLLVQRSHREISFYLGFVIPFPRALFVDGHPSGGVSPSILLLRPGSTLLLTSSVHSSPSCCFGLNHLYQSSLYRLNSNPPPPLHCYITQSFSLCQAVISNGGFAHHQFITHPLTMPAISALFLHWLAIYLSPVLERISTLQYFDFHLALCR
jgi:hypothetical protein